MRKQHQQQKSKVKGSLDRSEYGAQTWGNNSGEEKLFL